MLLKLVGDLQVHGDFLVFEDERFKDHTSKELTKSFRKQSNANQEHITRSIVNRGEWLWNPANIKGANKDFKIYVGRSTTVHNLLFCSYTMHELRNQHFSIG